MSNEYEVVTLYYDSNNNSITHEDGRVLDDISHLIPHKELEYLKKVGGTKYITSDEDGVMYELVAPIPEDIDIITFYYDKKHNVMLDKEGYVMLNIFAHIAPFQLSIFKQKKQDMTFYGKNGKKIELIYDDLEY